MVVVHIICVVGHRNKNHVWTFINLWQLTVPIKGRGVHFQVRSLLLQPFFGTRVAKLGLPEFRNVACFGQAILLFFDRINVRRCQTRLVIQVARAVINQSGQLWVALFAEHSRWCSELRRVATVRVHHAVRHNRIMSATKNVARGCRSLYQRRMREVTSSPELSWLFRWGPNQLHRLLLLASQVPAKWWPMWLQVSSSFRGHFGQYRLCHHVLWNLHFLFRRNHVAITFLVPNKQRS